jgi:catechol 2,3-dioxygenase-like lactoylglutathione lyase family enzyme
VVADHQGGGDQGGVIREAGGQAAQDCQSTLKGYYRAIALSEEIESMAMDSPTRQPSAGAMTRRCALLALSTTMVSPSLMAQQMRPVIQTRRLNNVMIAVSDLERSAAFYERLFGPPVRQGDTVVFRVGEGPHFFALTSARNGAKPDFLSYGMTVADFDAERVLRTLADLGVAGAQIMRRGDTSELFVPDPNGIKVQLQHTRYGYGSGPNGDVLRPAPTAVAKAAFQLKSLNHVTLTIANGAREKEFYQTVFGLPIRAMQGDGATLAIGEGTDGIVFNAAANNPNAVSGINHVCFTIEHFDAERVMAILIDNGLDPIENGIPALIKPLTCRVRWRQRASNGGGPTSPLGTPEVYFTDPDNIRMQIQDVSYCGGAGRLGQICP